MYRLLRPLVFALPPEVAHRSGIRVLRWAGAVPMLRELLAAWCRPRIKLRSRPTSQETGLALPRVMGLPIPHPIGLAAGLDKDGEAILGLHACGFSFIEVGTVTAEAQPGNPKPRLFRLPKDQALINRMGFNNAGAEAMAKRLARLRQSRLPLQVIGVNIGKSRNCPVDQAVEDYKRSALLVAPHADYLTTNVSSPNTPGLRSLQAEERLRPILEAVQQALATQGRQDCPILLKIAPDLAETEVDSLADLANELSLTGLIIGNTTVQRNGLTTPPSAAAKAGSAALRLGPVRSSLSTACASAMLARRVSAKAIDPA